MVIRCVAFISQIFILEIMLMLRLGAKTHWKSKSMEMRPLVPICHSMAPVDSKAFIRVWVVLVDGHLVED